MQKTGTFLEKHLPAWLHSASFAPMKILVVGKGGREHALITALKESPVDTELYCFPGSDAIKPLAKSVDVDGLHSLIEWMCVNHVELCVAGEEGR